MEDNIHDLDRLKATFCPPLDETVFYAIQSDYDLNDPESRQTFLVILGQLRDQALQEEYLDFDPSGTGGVTTAHDSHESPETQSRSTPEERSTSNGVTSITSGLSDLKWDTSNSLGEELENLPLEEKEQHLRIMFPQIHPYEISQILKKCAGAVNQTIDQLLNLSFLETGYEDGGTLASPIPKGINGFLAEENKGRKRKGRGNKKNRTNESSRASSAGSSYLDSPGNPKNVWASQAEDVDFICARTTLKPPVVKSIYHSESANLAATIRALAVRESDIFRDLADLDPITQTQIIDLKTKYPVIPESQLFGLLVLAPSNPSAAEELAELMVTSKEPEKYGKLHGVAQYAPLDIYKENEHLIPPLSSSWSTVNRSTVRTTAASENSAANVLFSKASGAHRRGKSNQLMGGVAAYYSTEGHKRAKAAKELSAAEADDRVNAHSTSTAIDLHGVSVSDAVRITRYRTESWWEGLGDAKYAAGGGGPVRAGFRIVTGVGKHSKDGTPRIGPAVSKMLMREGWKVHVEQGETIVHGKVRRNG